MLAPRAGDESDEILKLVGKAIELEGEAPSLLDTRGLAQLALNRFDLAARDLEDSIAVSPDVDTYFHLARVYFASGRRSDAERALNEAKARGLTIQGLHPLEQDAFRQLTVEFPKRSEVICRLGRVLTPRAAHDPECALRDVPTRRKWR